MVKSRLRQTVHCGRLDRSHHVRLVHAQYLHWPNLLTRCWRSTMITPTSNRTVCSSSAVGGICCLCLSRLRAPQAVPKAHGSGSARHCSWRSMRKDTQSGGKNFAGTNHSTHPIRSALEPFTRRTETQGVVLLVGSTDGAVHDAHGQWCRNSSEAGQRGHQLAIVPNHSASP